ncbi:hypothetical protein [uncultured Lentibacter sp.]|jgi:tetratricopeptide (TPR) repeat protein|uniref:tetratricopeptide repeat protein n=1 Tax=uncultured Lentibacter sp. TaxID=1659309 RepID=UPI00261AC79A|nr:hypothetical protein [uncultured Lentibacter sp.]
MRALLLYLLLATPLRAESCPEAPDHSVALAELVEAVRAAPNEMHAAPLNTQMWELWTDAPDAAAQAILDSGMRKRGSFDLLGARAEFDRLVAYCPDYAEGYNQRAFVNFIRQDYEPAIADLTRALALSPTHTGALTGRALSYYALGRLAEARADLEVALGLNPWLPERHMLADPNMKGTATPKGDDL